MSVYKSAEGKEIILNEYRKHLEGDLAHNIIKRSVQTPEGCTFILERENKGKPPLILLHGSVSNSASWLGVIPLFAEYFHVFCLDIPGEPGYSSEERLSLSGNAPALWICHTMDALGLDSAFFLGMSLGGYYALKFTVNFPNRVKALSLISAAGLSKQKASFILKAVFLMMLGKKGQKLLNKMIYHNVIIPKEILEYQALVSKHFNPVTEPLRIFTDKELLALTMPVQYIAGDKDALIHTREACIRIKKILPHVRTELVKNTGHAVIDRFGEACKFLSCCL